MLKKLASPRKRPTRSRADFNAPDAADFRRPSENLSQPKPSKESRAHTKKKQNAASTEATAQVVSDEAKGADNAFNSSSSSPQQFMAHNSRHEVHLESDKEDKIPTKKALRSPKKKLIKIPKPKKNRKLGDKVQEALAHDEDVKQDPLTPPKSDVEGESLKRKTRWKLSDIKQTNNRTASSNQNTRDESFHEENRNLESSKSSGNNVSHANILSRVRAESDEGHKRLLILGGSGNSDSEQESQTNVLSPLRRNKLEFDDTLPTSASPLNTDLLQQRLAQLDVPPAYQPEVHLIGEIVSGYGFGTVGGFTCKWRVEFGGRWIHIAGDQFGQTQLDFPSTAPWTSDPNVVVWSHPIDLHFATSAFQGWPKLLFQVWRSDSSTKLHVVGYGFVPVPFAAGQHKLWVSLWRPLGNSKEELEVQILGRTPELRSDDVIFNAAWSDRCRLRTVSTGKVLVHLGVLLRHFQVNGIEL